ncbi:MAG: thioredoxin-like domain-containing protein [Sulfurovaceae bacterium]|nr:thioredoxin-like domain-containing protein [Sulfurovaceae bacterium]
MKKIMAIMLFFFVAGEADEIQDKLRQTKAINSILFFYAPWCPACAKSADILNTAQKNHPTKLKIIGIDLDDGKHRKNFLKDTRFRFETQKMSLKEAKKYGVDKSIPVIYVLDDKQQVVKKYFKTPNKDVFLKLIDRLQKGFLANGTLPIEQRIDLWKMDRRQ